jgi:hypothetical protein
MASSHQKTQSRARARRATRVRVQQPERNWQQTRLWLTYPPKLITTPVIWELGQRFPVVTNIRQASVTDDIGIVCLELEGERPRIKAAIRWLKGQGISVHPVEINVLES